MEQLAFQRNPEASYFAASFRRYQQHHGAFFNRHIRNGMDDGKGKLVNEAGGAMVDNRDRVIVREERIRGSSFRMRLQHLLESADTNHITEFHCGEFPFPADAPKDHAYSAPVIVVLRCAHPLRSRLISVNRVLRRGDYAFIGV